MRGVPPSNFYLPSSVAVSSSPYRAKHPVPFPWRIRGSSSHRFEASAADLFVSKQPSQAYSIARRGNLSFSRRTGKDRIKILRDFFIALCNQGTPFWCKLNTFRLLNASFNLVRMLQCPHSIAQNAPQNRSRETRGPIPHITGQSISLSFWNKVELRHSSCSWKKQKEMNAPNICWRSSPVFCPPWSPFRGYYSLRCQQRVSWCGSEKALDSLLFELRFFSQFLLRISVPNTPLILVISQIWPFSYSPGRWKTPQPRITK